MEASYWPSLPSPLSLSVQGMWVQRDRLCWSSLPVTCLLAPSLNTTPQLTTSSCILYLTSHVSCIYVCTSLTSGTLDQCCSDLWWMTTSWSTCTVELPSTVCLPSLSSASSTTCWTVGKCVSCGWSNSHSTPVPKIEKAAKTPLHSPSYILGTLHAATG